MANALPARGEVPVEHTWDLASVFPDDAAWEAEVARILDDLPQLERFRGRLGEGPTTLADWFEARAALEQRVGRVYVYANLRYAADTTDQTAAALRDRAGGLSARANSRLAFAEPELLEVGITRLRAWVEAEPRLNVYSHYVETLARQREHVRSAEVETLLGALGDPFRTAAATHGILSDADLAFEAAQDDQGERYEIGQGNVGKLLSSRDRTLRRTAWERYADGYLRFKNTAANCLSAGVKQNVFLSRARRHGSALEAALAPHAIPVEVFHNLIDTFQQNLPTWHRYWRLRGRALGLDRLHLYDTRATLTEQSPTVPYEQAVAWIADGMAPLGDEYVSALRHGALAGRWVDRYPNRGKRMGAFSSGVQGTPPFIMMSYNDDLAGLSTLAHELGHSLHSYLSWRHQPWAYARYSLFVAEVASNFNQALVRAHLLETQTDPQFRIALLEEAMANFHRYFFVMPTLARFELEIHRRVERGEALNAAGLIDLMADLFSEGYGAEVELDRERLGITWAQFPTHLYANFYVYQYATGISGAHALAERVRSEPGAAEDYLDFLRAGGSCDPLDALRGAGVELTSPEPVERAFGVLADYVGRLEALLA